MPRQNRCRAWPHPSLCRRSGRFATNEAPDERNQTGILTSGLNLASAFPAAREPSSGNWGLYPVTVAQPSPIHTGFPVHLTAIKSRPKPASLSKNVALVSRSNPFAKNYLQKNLNPAQPAADKEHTKSQYVCVSILFDSSRQTRQSRREEMNVTFVTIKAVCACSGVPMSRWHLAGMRAATVGGFV